MEALDTFLAGNLQGVIIIIGLCLVSIGGGRIVRQNKYRSWVPIKGTIIELVEAHKSVALSQYGQMKYSYPVITYSYVFNNTEYTSSTVSLNIQNIWVPEYDDWGVPTKENERFWYTWKPGDMIDIYINSKYPLDSVIIKSFNKQYKSHNYALIIGGLLVLLAWLSLQIVA